MPGSNNQTENVTLDDVVMKYSFTLLDEFGKEFRKASLPDLDLADVATRALNREKPYSTDAVRKARNSLHVESFFAWGGVRERAGRPPKRQNIKCELFGPTGPQVKLFSGRGREFLDIPIKSVDIVFTLYGTQQPGVTSQTQTAMPQQQTHKSQKDKKPKIPLALFPVIANPNYESELPFIQSGNKLIISAIPAGSLGEAIQASLPLPPVGKIITVGDKNWYVVSQTSPFISRFRDKDCKVIFFPQVNKQRNCKDCNSNYRQLAQEAAGGGLTDEYRDKQAANAKFGEK